jgi:hypothetical protein
MQFWTHLTHHGLDSGEATTFPHILYFASLHGGHIQMTFCPGTPTRETVPKLSRFGLPGLWQLITPCSDLRSGWGLKLTCSSPWELSNGVPHSACTHRGRVDSRLLVVGSQIVSLTPGPSFAHNVCCRCPNGPCEAIFDMYASRPFQRYKEHLKARCFDPCNRTLNFWESRRALKSHFRECEWRPHTSLRAAGLRQYSLGWLHI